MEIREKQATVQMTAHVHLCSLWPLSSSTQDHKPFNTMNSISLALYSLLFSSDLNFYLSAMAFLVKIFCIEQWSSEGCFLCAILMFCLIPLMPVCLLFTMIQTLSTLFGNHHIVTHASTCYWIWVCKCLLLYQKRKVRGNTV